ncbi:hypothetical protein [Rhizobium sp. MHM7A]|uniref:hypothetical protein n=1 Tax=Rhizobium sp. MHM7A TaxID=2583233 RepID=UPI00110609A6|nr:hypothetical protein [Rhizobium sp. MHM7A]TLX16458.1 hypothetical protein FFR93_03740 [Rhizobium sp. MHM7A]
MGKPKNEKGSDSSNWVPGWFGSTLTVNTSSNQFKKHLKDRIAKAAIAKQAAAQSVFEKAEAERRFGM